jgi:hypothetical protein
MATPIFFSSIVLCHSTAPFPFSILSSAFATPILLLLLLLPLLLFHHHLHHITLIPPRSLNISPLSLAAKRPDHPSASHFTTAPAMPSQTRTVCRIILTAIAIAAIGGVHAAPPVKDTPPSPTFADHFLGSLYDVITGKGPTETPEQIKNSLKTVDLKRKSREYPNIEYTPPLFPTEVTKVLLPNTSIALLRYILERLPYGPLANRDLVIRYAQFLHSTKLPRAIEHSSESVRFREVCNTFDGDASTPGRFIQHFCHWSTPLMSLKDKTGDGAWTPQWLLKLSGYRETKGTIALLLVQIIAEIRLISRDIHPGEGWAHQVEEETYAFLTIRYPELLPDVIFAVKRHINSVPSSSGKHQKSSKAILDRYFKPLWGQQALNAFKESLEGLVKKSYNQVIPKPGEFILPILFIPLLPSTHPYILISSSPPLHRPDTPPHPHPHCHQHACLSQGCQYPPC